MSKASRSYVGPDVHKDSIAIALAAAGSEAPRFVGTVTFDLTQLKRALRRIGSLKRIQVVYEAGPCGYGLACHPTQGGYACEVIAPAKVSRSPADRRIKTDRRDALLLAREARAGNLVKVMIPDAPDEAIRDLSRAREDAIAARLKARQQLKALLLRHGQRYTGMSSWTLAHERYLAQLHLPHPAQHIAFAEYRQAVREAHERVDRITQALREHSTQWRMHPVVTALMSLRGIDFIAAVTLVAELARSQSLRPSASAEVVPGSVPSEHFSGHSRHQGAITKTGNRNARRGVRVGRRELPLQRTPRPILAGATAGSAQHRPPHRLVRATAASARYRRLRARQHPHNKICVALARELAGFVWAIARQITLCK